MSTSFVWSVGDLSTKHILNNRSFRPKSLQYHLNLNTMFGINLMRALRSDDGRRTRVKLMWPHVNWIVIGQKCSTVGERWTNKFKHKTETKSVWIDRRRSELLKIIMGKSIRAAYTPASANRRCNNNSLTLMNEMKWVCWAVFYTCTSVADRVWISGTFFEVILAGN